MINLFKQTAAGILWALSIWAKIPNDKYQHIVSAYVGYEVLQIWCTDIKSAVIITIVALLKEVVIDWLLGLGKPSVWDLVASVSLISLNLIIQ